MGAAYDYMLRRSSNKLAMYAVKSRSRHIRTTFPNAAAQQHNYFEKIIAPLKNAQTLIFLSGLGNVT